MIKFKFIQNLSIKNKIIAIILLVTFFIIIVGFMFIAVWDLNRMKSDIQNSLALNTKLVGDYCVVPLAFGDHQQATEALSRLKHIEFIETGCLYDKEDNLFAKYPDTLNKNSLLVLQEQQDNIFKDGYFYINEQVSYNDEIYGTLMIKANSKLLSDERARIIYTFLILTIVLIILSIILATKMQRYISSPIIKLKNHFDRIAVNHDFTARILKRYNDETGSLYDGFNNLLNQISIWKKKRDKAEKNLNATQMLLKATMESPEDMIILAIDLDYNYLFFNNIHKNTMKTVYSKDVAVGMNLLECMNGEEDIENAKANYGRAMKGESHITVQEFGDKERSYYETFYNPINNEKGEIVGATAYARNITDRKLAELEIRKLNEGLEQKVAERTKNLEEKNKELERFNDLFIDREFRIKELREELESLKSGKEN